MHFEVKSWEDLLMDWKDVGMVVPIIFPFSVHFYILSKPYGSWFWMMVSPHSSSLVTVPVMASGQDMVIFTKNINLSSGICHASIG